jgi:hypothetical protein
MKTRTAYVLFAFVLLLAAAGAGIVWAAQPAVDAPEAEAPEVTAPAGGESIVPSELDGLFIEPAEQGGCCWAECLGEWGECNLACNGDSACEHECTEDKERCLTNC